MAVDTRTTDPRRAAETAVAAMLARDAASTGLGIDVHDVAPGRARATMRVGAGMLNGHGTCHGGYVFLLADTAFAAACNSHGTTTVAAGADIVFAAPVHGGDLLVATATERTRYGRNGVYDVTVARDDGAVVAEFRGRSRELPRRVEGR